MSSWLCVEPSDTSFLRIATEWTADDSNLSPGYDGCLYRLQGYLPSFKPYVFHQTIRSLFIPLRLATDARNLEFTTSLDPNIDKVCHFPRSPLLSDAYFQIARWAAYEAQGKNRSAIRKLLKDDPNADGVVVGDEIRLRQIITNLARFVSLYNSLTPAGLMNLQSPVMPVNLPRLGAS